MTIKQEMNLVTLSALNSELKNIGTVSVPLSLHLIKKKKHLHFEADNLLDLIKLHLQRLTAKPSNEKIDQYVDIVEEQMKAMIDAFDMIDVYIPQCYIVFEDDMRDDESIFFTGGGTTLSNWNMDFEWDHHNYINMNFTVTEDFNVLLELRGLDDLTAIKEIVIPHMALTLRDV